MTRRDNCQLRKREKAVRDDLADQETFELEILKAYLPEQLGDAEIDVLIDEAIQASGANSMKDMGKVMGQLKAKLQGRANMGAVSGRIKDRLSG